MAELKGSKTENNLLEAFAGESQANRKYLAFSDKADAEGHKQVAKLFRAAAAAETVHAHAHLRALGGSRVRRKICRRQSMARLLSLPVCIRR